MHRPSRLLSTLLGAAALTAQTAPPDPILARLPADATNVLVVRDVLPFVDALLADEAVARTGAELAKVLAAHDLGWGQYVEAATLRRLLAPFRVFVPTEFVAAATPATTAAVVDTFVGAIAYSLLDHLAKVEDVDADLCAALTSLLATCAEDVAELAGIASLTLRDARVARRWFDEVADLLAGLPAGEALAIDAGEDRVTVRGRPFAAFGEAVLARLTALQVGEAAVERLRRLEVHARLEFEGATLRLTVGTPGAGPLPAAMVSKLWRGTGDQLAFSQFDCTDGLATMRMFGDLLDEGEWPGLTAILVEKLASRIAHLTPEGAWTARAIDLRLGLTDTQEYRIDAERRDEFEPVRADLRRCAADDGAFALTDMGLDVAIASLLGPLLTLALAQAPDLAGDALGAAAPLLEFLGGDDSAVFTPGVALVTRGFDLPAANLPFAGVALVAPARTAGDGTQFVDAFTEHLGTALAAPADAHWVAADLGLGAPTRTLAWAAFLPALAAFTPDGAVALHHVQKGPVMILSTDPTLTKAVLARLAAAGEPAGLPCAEPVAWGSVRGAHVAAFLRAIGPWTQALAARDELRTLFAADTLDLARGIANVLAPLAERVDRYDEWTEADGEVVRTTRRLALRAAANAGR